MALVKRAAALVLLAVLLPGCPALVSDPPPPPRKAEIPSAAPGAHGALAAGTDAAPRPEISPPAPLGGETETPTPEPAPEGSGGLPAPPTPKAPAPAPTPTNGLL